MATRGKSFNWTEEEDQLLLSGKSVEGRTAQQSADRRYKLRRFYGTVTARMIEKVYKRLSVLQQMNKLPKLADSDFLKKLRTLSTKIK